jgi:NodT family efflux transporter outer membrane factor (OMF) lipoprotein
MGRPNWIAMITLAVVGCATEPVSAPPVPSEARYTAGPALDQTASAGDVHGGNAQQLVAGQDIPSQWWTLFRSPALDELVRQALQDSPTLARAGAKLREAAAARETEADATQYPRVDAKLSANRIDVDPQSLDARSLPFPTPFNLFYATVGVSYNFDLFGATRHELAALQAEIDYQRYELEATRLALAANVVTAAIREAMLRELLASTEEVVSLQQKQLAIIERLEQSGTASREDVAAQRLELAQDRALVPDLQRQIEQVRHRLAVYTGQAPGAAQLPQFRLADLQLPGQLPVSLPSELARRRPDIRAAEALLREASEKVGVATANLYPQIALTATAGTLSTHVGDLIGAGTGFYLLGATLTQPIFHGGELRAKRRSAVAAYEQAGAAYQEAVLQGFQDVADVLRALDADARRLQDRAEAATQAQRYSDIVSARYQAGGVSYFTMLDSQRRLQLALLDRTRAVADRYADSAALLQSLGGGWWAEQAATEKPQ